MKCQGNKQVYIEKGYWRINNNSDVKNKLLYLKIHFIIKLNNIFLCKK